MTDEIERAQRALEGKCPDCDHKLPTHDKYCPAHPYRDAIDKIVRMGKALKEKLKLKGKHTDV